MNHIYKLKFDKRRREMVVSEITTGVGRARSGGTGDVSTPLRRGRTLALSMQSGLIMMAHPALAAGLPVGGQIVGGSGSIQTPSGSQMNVHQNSQNMIVNWHSFDIGQGNTVQFWQPDSSSVALNRVTGGSGSKIMGNLKANGQVFLVNPNGVLFGKGSSVNTAGFVATTRDIRNEDFMNGRYTFRDGGKAGAEIISQGSLTTTPGGYIVLAADRVSQQGTVRTPDGRTVLAAGQQVTLQLDNGGLTSVQVSGEVVNALVENRGLVSATNGQVYLTALGRDMLLNTVLNVSGVVEAGGMSHRDGNIVLDGGNSGVVHLSGSLGADSTAGRGGSITATGVQGGGEVYVGGGWQGKDSHIKNADSVVMQQGAEINASATTLGNGGTVVLWSENFTNFRGKITAKGGERGGNGGQVETSSHGNLQAFGGVDASAPRGSAGNWLLDPLDVTIVNGSSGNITEESDGSSADVLFRPSGAGSQVSNTSINNELNNGTSVTILTNSSVAGSNQSGNITVNAAISKKQGADATLTLKADGNITINNNITSTAGKLNISLLGAGSNTGMIKVTNSTLSSNGGDITLDRLTGGESNAMSVKVSNSTLNAATNDSSGSAGNITIRAYNPDINLSQSAFNTTVRNGGALLEISGNSTLSGNHILLESNQTGANSRNLPIYLNGVNITAEGNITLNAASSGGSNTAQLEIRGANNSLTSHNGTITISHNMSGSSSNNTGIYLNGTAGSNIVLNAAQNVTLNVTDGSMILNYTNVTSQNGSISVTGNSSRIQNAVHLRNTDLNASQGNISISGWSDYAERIAGAYGGGSVLLHDVNMTADNILINATNTNTTTSTGSDYNDSMYRGAAMYLVGNLTFTGNTAINATAGSGAAIQFGISTAYAANTLNMTFINGNATINASNKGLSGISTERYQAAIAKDAWNHHMITVNTQLHNANLTIDAVSENNPGIHAWGESYPEDIWNFSGTGNVSITGTSSNHNGIHYVNINASGLNGTTTLTGIACGSGTGVNLGNSHLTNVTVTGESVNGTGVGLNNTNVTNGTLNGTSANGTGVNITGNSTLNNTTVSGSSVNGDGTRLSEPVSLTNSTVTGTSVHGQGTEYVSPSRSGWLQRDAALHRGMLTGSEALQVSGYRPRSQNMNVPVCTDKEHCETGTTVTTRSDGVMPSHQHVEVIPGKEQ